MNIDDAHIWKVNIYLNPKGFWVNDLNFVYNLLYCGYMITVTNTEKEKGIFLRLLLRSRSE